MNPFSLSFGKEPENMVSRELQINEVVEGFDSENPAFQSCMVTGVRGGGKTVFMTSVAKELSRRKDWIVVELNPERNLLQALAAELSNQNDLLQIFKEAKINLSFLGLGLEIDTAPPITDITVALDRMLQQLAKKDKKVLVAIDEVVLSKEIKEFISQFQIFIRKDYPIFLLMTGLYENIYELQNSNTLTFLYRAPKIELGPLNKGLMAQQYKKIFDITTEESLAMADVTRGYPYAYQVLGYLCYKTKQSYQNVLYELDAYLEEYVYDKIWSEASSVDKKVLASIAQAEENKVENIRKIYDMTSNEFSVYRKRLIKKGLVFSPQYGYLDFTLPRFKEYVLRNQ